MEVKETRIIDLTYTIKSDMLVYPEMKRPVFQWLGKVNSEGYNLTKVSMVVHTGTHVDAPKHFLDDGSCIDEVSLNRLFGKAKLYRYVKKLKGQVITVEDVLSSGFQIEEDSIFVMETGIEKFGETKLYNEVFPIPSEELIEWVINKKIKAYMTDATTVDSIEAKDNPNHHLLLKVGIPIVENLKNLHLLPENKVFLISALPIKFQGRDAAPCRAVAVTDVEKLILEEKMK